MPVYDFECEKCGTAFEIERPMGSTARVKCVSCSSLRTTRVFSPAGVHFKGSGFYVTDSTGKSSSTSASTNGDSTRPDTAESGAKDSKASKPAKPSKSKPAGNS